MIRIIHIVPGINDVANGMVVVAKLLAKEQGDAEVVDLKDSLRTLRPAGSCDRFAARPSASANLTTSSQAHLASALNTPSEVWVHGMWLPKEWLACWRALRAGKRLVRMTHGSLSPLYLKYQSPFKKWLVGPIERWCLRRCAKIVATCEAEAEWIRAYEPRVKSIEVTDIKRFFDLPSVPRSPFPVPRPLHLLYLGRRHPLKGVEYLETAVAQLTRSPFPVPHSPQLKVVSNAFGEEKEKVWNWCDVLVLPTLSENFGLVIAEALERGKRVITTDGAPAWGEEVTGLTGFTGLYSGYEGRLIYLKGYRDGTDEERVELLKKAIDMLKHDGNMV